MAKFRPLDLDSDVAIGALNTAMSAGVNVPADISVVGFDDVDDAANYSPALTTVRQPFGELGRRAVAAVLGDAEPGGARPQAGPAAGRRAR